MLVRIHFLLHREREESFPFSFVGGQLVKFPPPAIAEVVDVVDVAFSPLSPFCNASMEP